MAVDPEAAEVKASGGVVWRRGEDGVEIVVAHRPRYDDWSLPKGKLDEGETWEQAALREVEEEVGLRCRLGPELEPIAYEDRKGRAKVVRYWLMEPTERPAASSPTTRSTRCAGWRPRTPSAVLSYPHDQELVLSAAEQIA